MSKKINVAVIFGGRSGEHEVSLVSAKSVIDALDKEKYEVVPIGITKEGQWFTGSDPIKTLKSEEKPVLKKRALLSADRDMKGVVILTTSREGEFVFDRIIPVDVIFPVLHGPYGEDGTIQGLFEMADIPFVGSGVLASSCAMDKVIMKSLFKSAGLRVTDDMVIKRSEWENEREKILTDLEATLHFPLFVKPPNLGSSVGINKAHDRNELSKYIEIAFEFDRKVLVEQAVPQAREIECSVLGNENPVASVPGEIVPCNEFYDYEAKYIAGKSQTLIPADLERGLAEEVKEMAVKGYMSLNCEGMARADFFLEKGTDRLYINELNTIPGFTSISMYPKLWEADGLPYSQLLDRLLELAIERHREKEGIRKGITLESDWFRR
ncbi:MAG: D-alanine--D-alanine ligase family protein [Candidatus Xenobiia bacterium LiM19]